MFLRSNVLNSLMKQAYKTGLTVAMNHSGWLYIASDWWQVGIKDGYMKNKTKGDLIALIGELPQPGERIKATKEGNQVEVGLPLEIDESGFELGRVLQISNVLLVGMGGTVERLLQDMDTGKIYVVNNVFCNIVDNGLIEADKGEYAVEVPFFNEIYGIMWKNNVCKLQAHFRCDDKNKRILERMQGLNISPEVPEE